MSPNPDQARASNLLVVQANRVPSRKGMVATLDQQTPSLVLVRYSRRLLKRQDRAVPPPAPLRVGAHGMVADQHVRPPGARLYRDECQPNWLTDLDSVLSVDADYEDE